MQPGAADAAAGTGFVSFCCFAYMVPIVIAVALTVLWVVALIDVLQRTDQEFPGWQPGSSSKVVWVLVVLLLHGLGALIYYFTIMSSHPRRRR